MRDNLFCIFLSTISGRYWSISRLLEDRQGVTAIEYALIAALIAVAAIVAFQVVGTNLSSTFSYVASQL